MNEKEYKKALKEIEKETKLMDDPLTDPSQKAYSKNRIEELNKQIQDYESNMPKQEETAPKVEEKSHLEKALEGSRENGLNASAAFTPNLGTQIKEGKEGLVEAKDASLKANPDYLEAYNKMDEAKMANRNIPGNEAKVDMAENEVQNLIKGAQLNENDKEAYEAQSDIEEAVAEAKGDGTPTTPQNVVTNLGNKYGFKTIFTPDGKIVPTEQSQWERADKVGKLAMFGTALSCIVSALSGGNIPPINFNKIVGVDKQYTTYLANVHQYNEAISAGAKISAENQAYADFGTYLNSLPENERRIITDIASDYEYTKSIADQERQKTYGKVQEDLINAQQKAGINAMLYTYEKVKKGELPKEAFEYFSQYIRATAGQGAWERGMNLISQGLEAGSNYMPGKINIGNK